MTDAEQIALLRAVFNDICRYALDTATLDTDAIGRKTLSCAAALDCPALARCSLPVLADKLGISRQALWSRVDKMVKDLAVIKGNHRNPR